MSAQAPALPEKMTAAVVVEFGDGKDVVKTKDDFPVPKFKDDQLLVEVRTASINPVDWKIVTGKMNLVVKRELPFVPGFDFAGVVAAVGKDCTRFKVGDLVYGDSATNGSGSYAEYLAVDETKCTKPSEVQTWEERAGLPLAGLTAIQGLVTHGGLKAGQRVLVLGGAGGVGHFAIQIAKILGAYVATTGSESSKIFLESLGADKIIDRNSQDWVKELSASNDDKVHIVFDCVGGHDHWERAQQVLVDGGIMVTIVGDSQGHEVTVGSLLSAGATVVGRKIGSLFGDKKRYHFFLTDPKDLESLNQLTKWADERKLKTVVDKVFPIEDANLMFESSAAGRTKGKLILKVSDDSN